MHERDINRQFRDSTAEAAVARVDRKSKYPDTSIHSKAFDLAKKLYPNPANLTRKDIAEICQERKKRSLIISSIQATKPSGLGELEDLNVQQYAARIVVEQAMGRRA